ncbi:hypothetical protein BDV96DRAFT_601491 [Lophiotrema nucula]|uniref:non-specific serine/threonine protein kinase n=1 Tax=Lophiotrema nucula TaxID=690887 RepID=A0A6A5Z1I6_9PLEO|nr:hypothetical protein BDV96DRAFT_601491 [Lophiotrema nucula]
MYVEETINRVLSLHPLIGCRTPDGRLYYVDHNTETTSWSRPDSGLKAAPSNTNFLDILNIAIQYQIPSIDLRYVGALSPLEQATARPPPQVRFGYALGGGYSATVIQHTVLEDIIQDEEESKYLVAKEGTLVALKKISPRPLVHGEEELSVKPEAYRSIYQELQTCCHPVLKKNENISNLLFIGWEKDATFPWIALELAAFGTLEDVLVAPGAGPTRRQKMNLAFDVVLGIAALHHVGIVHGDIKPANILVHRHPERQVIGQIADFGGSLVLNSTQRAPSIGTPMWSAPEISASCSDVDWKRADMWASGLVIASVFNHVPSDRRAVSSCLLEKLVPTTLDSTTRHTRIQLLKMETDGSPDSILSRCKPPYTIIQRILSHSLSAHPSNRTIPEQMVSEYLGPICVASGRDQPLRQPHIPIPETSSFQVSSEEFRSRDPDYRRLVLKHLMEGAEDLEKSCEDNTTDDRSQAFPHAMENSLHTDLRTSDPTEYVQCMTASAFKHKLSINADLKQQSRLAFQVALGCCLQVSTRLDEKEIVKWMYVAAKGGLPIAMWVFPLLSASCQIGEEEIRDEAFRESCLLIGACARNISQIRRILQDTATDASSVDDNGSTALHRLTDLEDEEVEGLAHLCYIRGASLTKTASQSNPVPLHIAGLSIGGPPISWAAAKGMPQLFEELIILHVEHDAQINNSEIMAIQAAGHHQHRILGILLEWRNEAPHLFPQDPRLDAEEFVQTLLGVALSGMGVSPLLRRVLHGQDLYDAQRKTIQLTIDAGADYLSPCPTGRGVASNATDAMIQYDDVHAMNIFIDAFRGSDREPAAVEALEAGLSYCLFMGSYQCFYTILERLPQLANPQPSGSFADDLSTLTPLNTAARLADASFARTLLEKGADPTIRHRGFSPLARAVMDGNLQTADVIYDYCSKEERDRTFDYNEDTGFSLMGRVMSMWHSRQRSRNLISAVRWIAEKGWSTFVYSLKNEDPIWGMILSHRPSAKPEEARLDVEMLELLFDLFPERLNTPDMQGCYPIHLATANGNRAAIELLLSRSVDINAESTGGMIPKGKTAFNLAADRLATHPPPDVANGGKIEIQRWRERMNDIIQLLLGKGAKHGEHPTRREGLQYLQYTAPNVQVVDVGMHDPDDETEWAESLWPEKLPSDETTTEEDRRDGGELMAPRVKSVLRTLLGPISGRRSEVNELSEEDRQDLEQYGVWLKDKVKHRRIHYKECVASGNPISDKLESDSKQDMNPSWKRWHQLRVPRFHPVNTQNGLTEEEEIKRLGMQFALSVRFEEDVSNRD